MSQISIYHLLDIISSNTDEISIKELSKLNLSYYDIPQREDSFFCSLIILNHIDEDINEIKFQDEIVKLKTQMLTDFDQEKLYQRFNYNPSMGSISDIQKMIHYNRVLPILVQFCADYLDINIFVIDKKTSDIHVYFNEIKLDRNKSGFIILKDNRDYYPVNKKMEPYDSFYRNKLSLPDLKYSEKFELKFEEDCKLKNKLLPELQEIARQNGIGITKISHTGKTKNKTKAELITELTSFCNI